MVTPVEDDEFPEDELEWQLDPQANYASMVRLGHIWSERQLQLELLESQLDSLIAEELAKYRPLPISQEEKKIKAKGAPAVKKHLEACANARARMLRAKVRYDAYRAGLDGLRTVAATQREELKRMSGMAA